MRRPLVLLALPLAATAVAGVLLTTGPLAPSVALSGTAKAVRADAPLRFVTSGWVRSVTVDVDGRAVPVRRTPGDGWQTHGAALESGERVVRVRAGGIGDLVGDERVWRVLVDGDPPPLAVRSNRVTDGETVSLRGRSEERASVRVRGGADEVSTRTGDGGRFELRVRLADGANRLAVSASDAAGNATTDTLRVTRDTQAPRLHVEVQDGTRTSAPTVVVSARDDTEVGVRAQLGERQVGEERRLEGKKLELPLGSLPDGEHRLTVIARDRAGHERRAVREVLVDSTETFGLATLSEGARGSDVRTFLRLMRAHGGYDGPLTGTLGPGAVRAVRAFQRRRDLPVDGLVGQDVRASLLRRLPARVVIDRSALELTLMRGEHRVRRFPVAVGMDEYPTPLGERRVVDKQVDPAWTPPDSPWAAELDTIPPGPGNPLGTRWIGLGGAIGIHGTYATGSIGTRASHGCVRMLIPDVEWLYEQIPRGTRASIRA